LTADTCPVCRDRDVVHFLTARGRIYWRCRECAATFVDRSLLPSRAAELARYRQHRNNPEDPSYRDFLNRLARPLLERLPPHQSGLDYGCGPGPALARMLEATGHSARLYDPLFHPDESALAQTYDFITCTEVVEHFHNPADEFERLDRLLRPGGWLGIMTKFLADDAGFADWRYRRDLTHVVFYKQETFRHVAARFNWTCEILPPSVVMMRKPTTSLT